MRWVVRNSGKGLTDTLLIRDKMKGFGLSYASMFLLLMLTYETDNIQYAWEYF